MLMSVQARCLHSRLHILADTAESMNKLVHLETSVPDEQSVRDWRLAETL